MERIEIIVRLPDAEELELEVFEDCEEAVRDTLKEWGYENAEIHSYKAK